MESKPAKHFEAPTLALCPQKLFPYLEQHLREDASQPKLRAAASAESRAVMMGNPDLAALLSWMLRLVGAKKVCEVGVFRGTTTLSMALALPADGKIVGLEMSQEYTVLGQAAWKEAGVSEKIDLRIGNAVDTMRKLSQEERGTFDLVFIDADKVGYSQYYDFALEMLKPGGIVALDNTLYFGGVVDPKTADDHALIKLNEFIRGDPRVDAVMNGIGDGVYFCRKL